MMPGDPVYGRARGRFPAPSYEEQRAAMMRFQKELMMPNSTPVPSTHPLKIAWESYKRTDDYENGKRWALRIAPMVQAMDPDGDRKRESELMPYGQRETLVEGALWAAFMAGWNFHAISGSEDAPELPKRAMFRRMG